MSNIKKLFSLGIFVFAFALVFGLSATKAEAVVCTATLSGAWSDAGTWDATCVGIPLAADSVIINTGVIVDVDIATPNVLSVMINNPAGASNGLTFSGVGALNTAGALTLAGSSVAGNSTVVATTHTITAGNIAITAAGGAGDSTVSVTSGSVITTTGGIVITGSATGEAQLTSVTGTITSVSGITLAGGTEANAQLTVTGAGTVNLNGTTGTLSAAGTGTVALNVASTVAFNGTGAQAVPVFTYGNLTKTGAAGTATLAAGGTFPIAGNLTVTTGTLALGTSIPTVTGTTTVATGGTLTMSTGTKTFTGLVTLNSDTTFGTTGIVAIGAGGLTVAAGTLSLGDSVLTVTGATTVASGATISLASATGLKTFTGNVTNAGTWTEGAVAVAVTFAGNLTNTGTFTATAGSGVHIFSSATGVLTGTLAIPSVSVSGTVANTDTLTVATLLTVGGTLTNNGTITATTALAGAGTVVNAATGILNLAGTSATFTLTATAVGNAVHYTGGAHTVKPVSYYDLHLDGTGTKTIGSGITIAGDLLITDGVIAALTGASTSDTLTLDGSLQFAGTWGAAGVDNINTDFFSGTGTLTVADGASTRGGGGGGRGTHKPPVTPPVTPAPGCSAGNLFNASTGAPCVNNTVIPGCGDRTTGFSASSGLSCVGNKGEGLSGTPGHGPYNFGLFTLRNGSKGDGVMELQRFLNAKLNLGLVLDGKLGPKTIAVIKKWQLAHGLVSDGLVGPKTKAKMNTEVN